MPKRSLWSAIRGAVTPSIRPARLLLALKTAIAAGLAWPIAQLLPAAVDEYSYYAPLGALISMMPTLMGSLRASLQTVAGLALGIGLSWLVILSPVPGVVSVPLVVGIGVLIGGLRGLGAGRDYVPIAALFVLVLGGAHADDYSVAYLAQMGVGMVIGIIVNLVIVPPLWFRDAARQIETLRLRIADTLGSMAASLTSEWPPEDDEWFEGARRLDAEILAAEPVLEDAAESRRLNPRARWHRYNLQEDYDDLTVLSVLGREVRDLAEAIGGAIWGEPIPAGLPDSMREPLGAALSSLADLVRAWNAHENERDAVEAAERALQRLHELERTQPPDEEPNSALGTITFSLRRAVAAVRDRVDRQGS